MKSKLYTAISCFVLVVSSAFAGAVTLETGKGPLDGDIVGGTRLRNLGNSGGGDIYAGVPDLGTAGNRVESNGHSWTNNTSHSFSFEYDNIGDKLVSTIGTTTVTYNNFLAGVTSIAGASAVASDWNALEIKLLNRQSVDHEIQLNSLMFNGSSLVADNTVVSGFNSEAIYQIWGHDFKTGFTLTGTMDISGPSAWATSQEKSRVNINFGYDTEAVPEPATMTLLGLGLAAFARRKMRKS